MMNDVLWAHVAKSIELLSPVVLSLLAWLSVQIGRLIDDRVRDDRVRGMLERLDDAVFTAVREVEQAVVGSLKEGSADGKLSSSDRAQAKERALQAIRSHFGAKGFIELGKVLGLSKEELERFLSTRIESAVFQLRPSPRPFDRAPRPADPRVHSLPTVPVPANPTPAPPRGPQRTR